MLATFTPTPAVASWLELQKSCRSREPEPPLDPFGGVQRLRARNRDDGWVLTGLDCRRMLIQPDMSCTALAYGFVLRDALRAHMSCRACVQTVGTFNPCSRVT